ncbi:predicted protein [Phaeodactylum tricornutum CCAP 1055/1]|uniref:Acid phosphatase n=1 Tax=Phaeodactylum tricornutum (strain CCAP 1055/1) TaxID=556484 RepID=B7G758_PHATC|nr:predicted protein [Phaeodactylum tricornutum CCAP 1055/1]EEC45710.1 predicted protein [Phaeodactylum tricornutum CCAP 1055/1]|eukprot:XP_002182974.1 predicted protein [Phaeodactylum tricornutum CCAP 1055/1]
MWMSIFKNWVLVILLGSTVSPPPASSMWMTASSGSPTIRQVHVITRHGARYPLQKNSDNLKEQTRNGLTPLGVSQLHSLGGWLAIRYDAFFEDGAAASARIRLESSALQRTIESANALALGFWKASFPNDETSSLLPANSTFVPLSVYSTPLESDIRIRAYDKCVAFHKQLDRLYESETWIGIENDNRAFLGKLASIPKFSEYSAKSADGGRIVPLKELWNVFDLIHVAKTECEDLTGSTCQSLADPDVADVLNVEEWTQLQGLAHRAELLKYRDSFAGRMVGANLLLQILERMQDTTVDFFLYSAHYPTILGLLSALDEDPIDTLPDYGTALLFEVYYDNETNTEWFQIKYRPGDIVQNSSTLVSLGKRCHNATCQHLDFDEFLSTWSVTAWCNECGTESTSVCSVGVPKFCSSDLDRPVLVGFFVGLVSALAGIGIVLSKRFLNRRNNAVQTSQQQEHEDRPPKTDFTDHDSMQSPYDATMA